MRDLTSPMFAVTSSMWAHTASMCAVIGATWDVTSAIWDETEKKKEKKFTRFQNVKSEKSLPEFRDFSEEFYPVSEKDVSIIYVDPRE